MRISQPILQQNLLNFTASSDTLKALVGKAIEGQVVAAEGKALAFQYQGQLFQVRNDSDTPIQEGARVQLEIMSQEEGVLSARLIRVLQDDGNTETVRTAFRNAEDQSIFDALKALSVPVTKENLQAVRQSTVEVKALLNALPALSDTEVQSLIKQMDQPLRDLVLRLIQGQNGSGTAIADAEVSLSSDEGENAFSSGQQAETNGMKFGNQTGLSAGDAFFVDGKEVSGSENVGKAELLMKQLNLLSSENPEQIKPESGNSTVHTSEVQSSVKPAVFTEWLKEIALALKGEAQVKAGMGSEDKAALGTVLESFDSSASALLLKQSIPLTIKNLLLVENQQVQIKSLGDSMVKLSAVARQIPLESEELTALIRVLKDDVSNEEKLNLIERLIAESTMDDALKKTAEKEISFVREAGKFTPNYNDQVIYMQVPIRLQEQERTVDLYFKARHKKLDPEDLSVLVALQTNRYGEVQCLVGKQGRRYSLNFSLETESAKKEFEGQVAALEKQLKQMDVGTFDISFSVKSTSIGNFREISKESAHSIDIRV